MSPPSLGWAIRAPIRFGSPRDSGHWSRCNRRTSRRHHQTSTRTRGIRKDPGVFHFSVALAPIGNDESRAWTRRTPLSRHRSLTIRLVVQDAAAEWLQEGCASTLLWAQLLAAASICGSGSSGTRPRPSKPMYPGSIPGTRSIHQGIRLLARCSSARSEPRVPGVLMHGELLPIAYSLCNGVARPKACLLHLCSMSLNVIFGP